MSKEIQEEWDIVEDEQEFNNIQEEIHSQSHVESNEMNLPQQTIIEQDAYLNKFEFQEEEGVEESEDLEVLSDEDAGDYSIGQFSATRRSGVENIEDYHEQFGDYDLLDRLAIDDSQNNLNQEEPQQQFEPEDFERDFEQQDIHEVKDGCLSADENEKDLEEHQQITPVIQTSHLEKQELLQKPTKEKTLKSQPKRSQTKDNQLTKKLLKEKQKQQKQEETNGTTISNTKNVDILLIGGGPATLGFLVNSIKNNKFGDLIQNDGIAVLETGLSLGGGNLSNYGINSNTSANGFVKCILRKVKKDGTILQMPLSIPASNEKYKLAVGIKVPPPNKQMPQQKKPKQKANPVLASAKKIFVSTEQENSSNVVTSPTNKSLLSPKVFKTQELIHNPQSPRPIGEFKSPEQQKLSQTYTQNLNEKKVELANQICTSVLTKRNQKQIKNDFPKAQTFAKQLKIPAEPRNDKPFIVNYQQLPATLTATNKGKSLPGNENQQYDEDIYNNGDIDGIPPCLCFKEFVNSNIVQTFKQFGRQIVPLSLVGHLLNYVGNNILYYAHQLNRSKIFYPMHKALSVSLMANGDIITKVQKTDFKIMMIQDQDKMKTVLVEGKQSLIYFRSKAIVIAGGATQGLHPQIYSWFPSLVTDEESKSKLITSDSFLKKWEFLSKIRQLKQLQDQAGYYEQEEQSRIFKRPLRKLKIVIIGGSHSGFSCAWMLLNGPSLSHNNYAGIFNNGKPPFAIRRQIKNCSICCCSEEQASNSEGFQSRDASIGRISKLAKGKAAETEFSQPACKKGACQCVCKCFGYFKYDDWGLQENDLQLPIIEEGDIKILYRDNIKVFFKTSSDAVKANYHDFDKEKYRVKDGYVYSFTGLRGDAKNLYLRVKNGLDKRVQFVKARTPEQQRVHVDQADLVIWACGYQSQAIPIYENNKLLKHSQNVQNTQFDVDKKCRILLEDGSVLTKCFACGVGFPVRTKDGLAGIKGEATNPRADSFSLYMNTVAEMLMKNLIPKKRMAIMTQQRAVLSIGQEPNAKTLQTCKKKKAKDLLSILGANVFSQSYLLAQSKPQEQKIKVMQTQKHIPQKAKQLQEIFVLNSTPQFIAASNMMQVVIDPIGNGLTDIKAVQDQKEETHSQYYDQVRTNNNSRSVERHVSKVEASEFITETKASHNRGMSYTRLGGQLIYSDSIKRNNVNKKKPFPEENEYMTHDSAQIYLNNMQYQKHRAAFLVDDRTHKMLDYQDKLQFPDIRGKDNQIKTNKSRGISTKKRDLILREAEEKQIGLKSMERANSRKRQQFNSDKSPLLFQKKHNAISRVDTGKQQVAVSIEKPKSGLQKFMGPVFTGPCLSANPEKNESCQINDQDLNQKRGQTPSEKTEVEIASTLKEPIFVKNNVENQEPATSKRKPSNFDADILTVRQGKSRQTIQNSSANQASRSKLNRKPLEQRPIGNRKVNIDIKEVINGNYKAMPDQDNIFKVNNTIIHDEKEQVNTEFPPINQRVSQIPTIKQAKKNMVQSHSTIVQESQKSIGLKNPQSQTGSARGLKNQTIKPKLANKKTETLEQKEQKDEPKSGRRLESAKEMLIDKELVEVLDQRLAFPNMSGQEVQLQQINQLLTQSYVAERSRLLSDNQEKKSELKKAVHPIAVSQSQHFKKVKTLTDGHKEQRKNSPEGQGKKNILLVNEQTQYSEGRRKGSQKLNNIYAPYEFANREEFVKILKSSPIVRTKSKAPESSLDYHAKEKSNSRSDIKQGYQKVGKDLYRNEKHHGVKSASIGIKASASVAFTPGKAAEAIKMEHRNSLVNSVISQMTVNPSGLAKF